MPRPDASKSVSKQPIATVTVRSINQDEAMQIAREMDRMIAEERAMGGVSRSLRKARKPTRRRQAEGRKT